MFDLKSGSKALFCTLITIFVTTACSNSKDEKGASVAQFDGLDIISKSIALKPIAPPVTTSVGGDALAAEPTNPVASLQKQVDANLAQIKMFESEISKKKLQIEASQQEEITLHSYSKAVELEFVKYDLNSDRVLYYAEVESVIIHEGPLAEESKLIDAKRDPLFEKRSELYNKIDKLTYIELWFTSKKQELEGQLLVVNKQLAEVGDEYNKFIFKKQTVVTAKLKELQALQKKYEKLPSQLTIKIVNLNADIKTLEDGIKNLTSKNEALKNSIARVSEKSAAEKLEGEKKSSAIQLNILKSEIAAELSQGKKVKIEDLLKATILNHLVQANKVEHSLQDSRSRIDTVIAKLADSGALALKANFEAALSQEYFKGVALKYNRDAVTVVSPLFENRLQCYSGTSLFLLTNESLKNPNPNSVVIFTNGHVLPGFVRKNEAGQIVLTGIETTAGGKAVVEYGQVSDVGGDIRVFDAQQFMVVELFKNEITNINDVYKVMLATVEKYGFKTAEFEPLAVTNQPSSSYQTNSSPLAFGYASVPEGDQVREAFDIKLDTRFTIAKPTDGNDTPLVTRAGQEILPCEHLRRLKESGGEEIRESSCEKDGQIIEYKAYLNEINRTSVEANQYAYSYIREGQTIEKAVRADDSVSNNCTISNEWGTPRLSLSLRSKNKETLEITIIDPAVIGHLTPYFERSSATLKTKTFDIKEVEITIDARAFSKIQSQSSNCKIQFEQIRVLLGKKAYDNGLGTTIVCDKLNAKMDVTEFRAQVACLGSTTIYDYAK